MSNVENSRDSVQNADSELPKQFISSLKILFEILDENRNGFVRLCDIESRWSDQGVKGLPFGVIEALRKVTPPNGLLTFSRFVSGLKLALFSSRSGLENGKINKDAQTDKPADKSNLNKQQNNNPSNISSRVTKSREPSVPGGSRIRNPVSASHVNYPVTAAVKPNNAASTNNRRQYPGPVRNDNIYRSQDVYPPPRPERSRPPLQKKSLSGSDMAPPKLPPRDVSKSDRVLVELKNWQKEYTSLSGSKSDSKLAPSNIYKSDPHAIYANIEQFQKKGVESSRDGGGNMVQKPVRRQNSARRHTLSSGVDYNAIKRMKQLEEERDVLLQGLEMTELCCQWYRKQLAAIHDKQKYLGKTNLNEHSLEAHQERMNFQKSRIMEVNQQLKTLIESSEKGFPLHMNLAVTPHQPRFATESTIKMLKGQNRQLTQEVTQKSDKITQLEREKGTLIRELFEARCMHKTNYDDTTFM
ncbi:suppressor APC domain-containing protein 2-like [Gigantopelta aegis]|uniref:suppressor APC domain-containing protein 2-like n=1 Tax=Gigantopelta aegis TaxID=1735272 RepID=UPI001B88E44B|nr:suppressor APC domain-containing protein 2-like [Gigantopelta aegis]